MGSYIVIQDWMLDLGLRGSELTAYALVWGFTQDGESWYMGSRQYTAKWLRVQCLDSVTDIFRRLVKKGFLRRKTGSDSKLVGGRYTWYQAVSPSDAALRGVAEFFRYGSGVNSARVAECAPLHNNIVDNIVNDDSISPLTPLAENLENENSAQEVQPIESKTPTGVAGASQTTTSRARARKSPASSPVEVLKEVASEAGKPVSDELRNTWELLCDQPKWRKKSADALKMNARKLFQVPEREAITMMQNSIAGDWQGLFWLKDNERKELNVKRNADGTKEDFVTREKRRCLENIARRHGGVIPAGMYGPDEIRIFPADADEQMNAEANDPRMIEEELYDRA